MAEAARAKVAAPGDDRVAFILPTFPNLTGTFYVNEIIEVGKRMAVQVLALERGRESQTGMEALQDRVAYLEEGPYGGMMLARLHAATFLRRPAGYLRALAWALRGRKFGMLKRFRRLPLWALKVRREGVTHIHAHFADYATETAMMLSDMTGAPFSFTGHAHDIYVSPRFMTEKMRKAAFVITCTEHNRRHLLDSFPFARNKVVCLYHGIYADRFTPPPSRRNDVFQVLCVGRMVEKKGMEYLLRACRPLIEGGLPLQLTLVGDGPEREHLEALAAELGLNGCVRFTGALRHEELLPLYRSADCFCLPSFQTDAGDRDGIPNVIPEAMATELPVISTDVSGIPELLEDGVTGLVVPQKSVEPIGEKLRLLARDPELRRRLGRQARERVLQVFDVRKTGETLAALFADSHGARKP